MTFLVFTARIIALVSHITNEYCDGMTFRINPKVIMVLQNEKLTTTAYKISPHCPPPLTIQHADKSLTMLLGWNSTFIGHDYSFIKWNHCPSPRIYTDLDIFLLIYSSFRNRITALFLSSRTHFLLLL